MTGPAIDSAFDPAERGDFSADRRVLRIALVAALVGALGTLAAWGLLDLIRFFTNLFFFQRFSDAAVSPAANTLGAWVVLVPVAGGLVIGLLARYGSEKIRGHGMPEAIEAILFGQSRMSARVAVLKPLSSGIAIGSGGPFGAEGPIIMTGGALGSLVGQYLHITGAERKTLLVAGATAGMTAVFGTPVAAVLLAIELLLFELRPRSLLPVAIACSVAGLARTLLFDPAPLFALHLAPVGLPGLAAAALAGVLAGALAWVVSTSLYKVEDLFAALPLHWMWWPALGGLAVGFGGWLQPRALGVGYDVIDDLLHSRLALEAVVALIACKAGMWVVALGSGTSGGVLAPLLMMGAGLGLAVAPWMPGGDPALWPLVFMAATLGGMMRAPVMAVIFGFELTHATEALLPMLVATAVAYGFTVLAMPRSILTEKIARRGRHIYREYGVDPLERHAVAEVMTREVATLSADVSLDDALARALSPGRLARAGAAHHAFPVVRGDRLVGMLAGETLAAAAASTDEGLKVVGDLFGDEPPLYALPGESCRAIATRLAVHDLERLPVVADDGTRRLVGIVSRSDLVKPSLELFEEEHRPERLRATPLEALQRRFRTLTERDEDGR